MQHTAALLCHAHSTFIDRTEPTHYALNWTKYTTSNDHISDPARHHLGTRCAVQTKTMSHAPTGELSTKVQTAPTNSQTLRQSPLRLFFIPISLPGEKSELLGLPFRHAKGIYESITISSNCVTISIAMKATKSIGITYNRTKT